MTATILVADDDADVLALVGVRLERDGHRVITAGDGRAALTLATGRRPDLAVLDVMMAGLDGYEVVRAIRANDATCEMPVILLTARVQEDDRARGVAAGADFYLEKPFSPNALRDCVQRALAGRD